MSEEFKHDHECICKSKGFKKFLTSALGTFVGVFCALSLFCALHKPPMMMGPMGSYAPHPMMYGAPMGMHHCNCPCHKKMMKKFIKCNKEMKKDFNKEMENKPEIDD